MCRVMESSRLFEIIHGVKNSRVLIDWQRGKPLNWFILRIREAHQIADHMTFLLLDNDGIVVLSATIMPGRYRLQELESTDSVQGIAMMKVNNLADYSSLRSLFS